LQVSSPDFSAANLLGVLNDALDGACDATRAVIADVRLDATSPGGMLGDLGADAMSDADLLALLASFDPEAAAALAGASREAIMQALIAHLDPDGDGQVAALRWSTLEERGTIGFFVDRSDTTAAGPWQPVANGQTLPGLIDAPLGGEYLLADPQAQGGILYYYRLIEQEAWGRTRSYGPYPLRMR
jgi:hypothetical protein